MARQFDQLARFAAVTLDKLGYVPFDKPGADMLFGFISRRYECGSLVVTTNLPFAHRSEVSLSRCLRETPRRRLCRRTELCDVATQHERMLTATDRLAPPHGLASS